MKLNLTGSGVLAVAGLVALGLVALELRRAAASVRLPDVRDYLPTVDTFNPWSRDNVAYQTANRITTAATGREESFGGWLYDVTHADPVTAPPPPAVIGAGTGYDAPGLPDYFAP